MTRRNVFLFVQAAFLSLAVGSYAFSAIIFVDHESTATTPDGSTWALSYPTLQDALENASSGDSVWVADGVYYPTVRTDPGDPRSVTFMMLEGVKIFGGFQGLSRSGGGETSLPQRNPDLYETNLSGNIGERGDATDNARIVVTAEGTSIDTDARLNGLTIRDAYGYSGLWIKNGAFPLVIRCTITGNHTPGSGGAVRIEDMIGVSSSDGPQFLACTFSHNDGPGHGAILVFDSVSVIFVNCLAFGNVFSNTSFIWANGLCDLTMINCTVTDNFTEAEDQTAVKFLGHDCLISNCVLWGNSNGLGQSEAAQLVMFPLPDEGGTATVRNCLIQGLDEFAGNYNFDGDPLFVNAGGEDFSLEYLSPALNNGDASDVPADDFDIDDDSDTTELLPDRGMQDRQVNPTTCVDVGSWEEPTSGTCAGDITDGSGGGPDGDVGDPDLDLVLDTWNGPGGVADVYPADCGNSYVDIDDLVFVVTHWGSCSSFGPQGPIDVEDAIDILLAFMAEHEEHTVLVLESIEYITENGL